MQQPTNQHSGVHLPRGWQFFADPPTTLDEATRQLLQFADFSWLYRGECRIFPTRRPSLTRNSKPDTNTLRPECQLINDFASRAHPILSPSERAMANNVLGWMVLLQHHGAPTRLLDWTQSCWVAAYFACCQAPREHGYIWGFDHAVVHRSVQPSLIIAAETLIDAEDLKTFLALAPITPPFVMPMGVVDSTDRMIAQQSTYTFGHPATADHAVQLGQLMGESPGRIMIIPAPLKQPLLQRLHQMNVNAASLFPGIDGVGRHVREIVDFGLRVHTKDNWSAPDHYFSGAKP